MTNEPLLPEVVSAPQFQFETTADLALAPLGMTIVAGHKEHDPTIKRNFTKIKTETSGALWVSDETFWVTDGEIALPAVITYDPRWK